MKIINKKTAEGGIILLQYQQLFIVILVFQSDFILIWRRARSNLLSALLSNFSAFCGALQRDIIVMANQPAWSCTGLQERTIEPYFNVRASADRNEVFRCRRHLQSRRRPSRHFTSHTRDSPPWHLVPGAAFIGLLLLLYVFYSKRVIYLLLLSKLNKHIFLRKERARDCSKCKSIVYHNT